MTNVYNFFFFFCGERVPSKQSSVCHSKWLLGNLASQFNVETQWCWGGFRFISCGASVHDMQGIKLRSSRVLGMAPEVWTITLLPASIFIIYSSLIVFLIPKYLYNFLRAVVKNIARPVDVKWNLEQLKETKRWY